MRRLLWFLIAAVGAAAWGVLALYRGETINAAWLVLAAVGTYLIAYRVYSRFLAYRVFGLTDRRATPAERLNNGRDFVPTTRWVLFGHHFAAIAGAGPLVGPVLAAQFGYLPGIILIVFGVVLGGAVQDFIFLFGSMRRDGKSLGQMAKKEIGELPGLLAMVAILAIMVILLAVLALVVVNALKDSPWDVFTNLCTIPIAVLMGFWMKVWRPGRTVEATVAGIVLLMLALVGGAWVAKSPLLAPLFTHGGLAIAWAIILYVASPPKPASASAPQSPQPKPAPVPAPPSPQPKPAPAPAPQPPRQPKQADSSDIFDIIEEAPSPVMAQAAPMPPPPVQTEAGDEEMYEVEPEFEVLPETPEPQQAFSATASLGKDRAWPPMMSEPAAGVKPA